jgi:hypothetical protein
MVVDLVRLSSILHIRDEEMLRKAIATNSKYKSLYAHWIKGAIVREALLNLCDKVLCRVIGSIAWQL